MDREDLQVAIHRAIVYFVMYGSDNDDWIINALGDEEDAKLKKVLLSMKDELAMVAEEYYEELRDVASKLAKEYTK